MMEIFNCIAGFCSIVGLLVSIFVASKIIRISNSNNNNREVIQSGEGEKKAVLGDGVINAGGSVYNDYRNSKVYGEVDNMPVLTQREYFIEADESYAYSENISEDSCKMANPGNKNNYCFAVDFERVVSAPTQNQWIGYTVKSLPMSDWRSFIEDDYNLEFDYMAIGNIKNISLEITAVSIGEKLCRKDIELQQAEQKFCLPLKQYKNKVNFWKAVNEICFVFFPQKCLGQKGTVFITNVTLVKNK